MRHESNTCTVSSLEEANTHKYDKDSDTENAINSIGHRPENQIIVPGIHSTPVLCEIRY